ncbi:hypothetical protein Ahy_A01g000290 [Arachis hypogaea]|uniref:Ninja-family protein n=1 Tax=Arachis hypogaea TaxID=3818 RepID=A0A445EJY5_ARAHY|nr:hypothetical protein Ahy_A01g000290 [Arachis hypogaea]
MSDFSRNLLKMFMSMNHHHHHELQQQQHRHAKKIKRTTSIPEFSFSKSLIRDEDNNNSNNNNQDIGGYSNNMPMPCTTNLIRTCSLPTETEEEWRKRKELQRLRRLEERRKRSEK